MNVLTDKRFILGFGSIVTVCSAFIFYRRLMVDWVAPKETIDFLAQLHGLTMGIPFYFLVLMYLVMLDPQSRLTRFFNWITDIKIISPLAFVAILVAYFFYFIKIPVLLGSWTTLSVVVASVWMVSSMLRDKMPPALAFVAGIGVMGIWVGWWEIPYQWAMKLIYDMPQPEVSVALAWNLIYWETVIEIPMFGCGLWSLIVLNKKYHFIQLNKWAWTFFGLYVAFMTLWIANGFWCDVTYDWTINKWIQTPEWNKPMMFTYKMSKVWFMLALIFMIKRGETKCVGD